MTQDIFPVTGLGPGTILLGSDGEIPVEWLSPGDRLITRDHGAQQVHHIVRLRAGPGIARLPTPIVFHPGEYGPGGALTERLRVAPGLRGLIKRPECALDFGTDEVLSRFGDLSRRMRVRDDPSLAALTYHLILMGEHEIISAGSLWVETVDPDTARRLDVPPAVQRSSGLFDPQAATARRCLTRDESLMIRQKVPAQLTLLDILAA